MQQDVLVAEFNRQLNNLLKIGYPKKASLSVGEFVGLVKPLVNKLSTEPNLYDIDIPYGTLPFVIVVTDKLVATEFAMTHVSKDGKNGIVKLNPNEPSDFNPIKEITIPQKNVYLMLNIDRGKRTLNIRPSEAFEILKKDRRSPLTVDEGVAIITHYPEFLIKNNCFSLLASRHTGDKRVPAIWINSRKEPNLGWCWNGNPHTWLGSASCSGRVDAD